MVMTVAQLIEELQRLPPGLEVLTTDCCYGRDHADTPIIEELEVKGLTKLWRAAKPNEVVKNYVVIG